MVTKHVIVFYFREIYHGSVWNTDSRFLAPMVKLSDGKSIFLRDCVYLNLAELGTVVGVVVKFFQEVIKNCLPPRILYFTIMYVGFFK